MKQSRWDASFVSDNMFESFKDLLSYFSWIRTGYDKMQRLSLDELFSQACSRWIDATLYRSPSVYDLG
jgi:hypothetical protein